MKVLALEGHVLDLQRQLQQLELQRTHERCAADAWTCRLPQSCLLLTT